jgi:hypothetical protein
MPKIRTVADVAEISARCMKMTARVGDPEEDASMAVMRPLLSKINTLGFVTSDSQKGSVESYTTNCKKSSLKGYKTCKPGDKVMHHQRAYIDGLMDRSRAKAFVKRANLVDGMLATWCEFTDFVEGGKSVMVPSSVPVTRVHFVDGSMEYTTWSPFRPRDISSVWWNLLPETGLVDDVATMNRVKKVAVAVSLMDLKWGRERWLFKKSVELLSTLDE